MCPYCPPMAMPVVGAPLPNPNCCHLQHADTPPSQSGVYPLAVWESPGGVRGSTAICVVNPFVVLTHVACQSNNNPHRCTCILLFVSVTIFTVLSKILYPQSGKDP